MSKARVAFSTDLENSFENEKFFFISEELPRRKQYVLFKMSHVNYNIGLPLLKKHLTFFPCTSITFILCTVSLQIKWISISLHWLIPNPTTCFLLPSSDLLSLDCTFAFDCLLLLLEFAQQVIFAEYSVRLLVHLFPRLSYSSTEQTASTAFSLHANFGAVVIPLLLLGICFIKFSGLTWKMGNFHDLRFVSSFWMGIIFFCIWLQAR